MLNKIGNSFPNWRNHINAQIVFYKSKNSSNRYDDDFHWTWYNSVQTKSITIKLKNIVKKIIKYCPELKWFNESSEALFNTRQILEDEYSKLQFDMYILLKVIGHKKFFFPRTYFEDFLLVENQKEFTSDLPKDFSGLSIKIFKVKVNDSKAEISDINLVTTEQLLMQANKWRQYFIRRNNLDMTPSQGDIVFDCGSCIGDTSLLFAAYAGTQGEVHSFDPVPLHNCYSRVQAELNPMLTEVFHINELAIGNSERKMVGSIKDISKITAGGCAIDDFNITTIDSYSSKLNKKVDYIKMDIEGAEIAALQGASATIAKCKPKLAISAYHKEDDLWKIPQLIKELNPGYKLYFEHHLPIFWESCFYAT